MGRPGRHRAVRVLLLLVASLALASVAHAAPPDEVPAGEVQAGDVVAGDGGTTIEPALEIAVDSAPTESSPIALEILTQDTAAAVREVELLGGTVSGSLPGELVQAVVPAAAVDDVDVVGRELLRTPLRVNRPTPIHERHELGPLTGQSVAITNADAWHVAGHRGAVKVGVIDFFDLGLWNPAEHGPRPDAAHIFCRDTSARGPNYCPMAEDGRNEGDGDEHGVAVVEVLKDMAPDAELYIATVGTTSDMRAAIDWFATNGVFIVNRSLGSAYDGPGDGTGPLGALVDHAAALGITWFNSAGNDAADSYGRFTGGVAPDGYVDFDNGPGVDTALTLTGTCIGFDGIRWNDWRKPPAAVTDYRVEIHDPVDGLRAAPQASQVAGAPPLELVDHTVCTLAGRVTLRLRRIATGGDPAPDVIELALFSGRIEPGRSEATHSAAKPVVDSSNPALVAVGAVDPPAGTAAGFYSSQGPTNDGRVKPDVVAPSCLTSSIYRRDVYGPAACFNGTSAASPVAAGAAAVLLGRGLARTGAPLAALVRHLVVDAGPLGPDNTTGHGIVELPPPPPAAVDTRPTQFVPLAVARRILDTRALSPTPGARIGPFAPATLVDLPISSIDLVTPLGTGPITAVAVSIVSVDSPTANYVQALPTLLGQLGGFANLNVGRPGQVKPNFAIVPVGSGGSITLFLAAGGNVVVDLMGTFAVAPPEGSAAGRFVPVAGTRVLDTRPGTAGPVPSGWTPHKPGSGSTVRVEGLPAATSAVVLNVTATEADAPGFLRAQRTDAAAPATANGNYEPGVASGTLSIVPVAADGSIEIHTSAATHIVVDLVGAFTGESAAVDTAGLFTPVTPVRASDSRAGSGPLRDGETRAITIAGSGSPVPAGAIAVSANLASDAAVAEGFLTLSPRGAPRAVVSNLNYPRSTPISNATLAPLGAGGALDVFANRSTHVIIDVNGYFTASG